MQRKYDYDSFKSSAQSILRSSTFISSNAFFALIFFCSSQYVTGKFYYYAVSWLPGFLGSSMAVMIEKPSRRSSLAFYVANVASETLFRIYVAKGYMRAIPNGQVYLFALSIATIMWLAKRRGFEDDPLSSAVKFIVGPEEAGKRVRRNRRPPPGENSEKQRLEQLEQLDNVDKEKFSTQVPEGFRPKMNLKARLECLYNWLRFILSAKHKLCPHYDQNSSCLSYAIKASSRAFLLGSAAQLGLRTLSKLPSLALAVKDGTDIYSSSSNLLRDVFKIDLNLFRMGLFLSTFSGFYKLANCSLRWAFNSESNCFISGLLAGPSFFFYPSPTIALYVLWKCLENLFNEAVQLELIKNKNLFIILLYGIATNQLFYSALMDPKYMKKSYMAFLHRMSRHKLHLINRSVLDIFGTQASAGYEEFFPDLHPKFMSTAFLGSIWIWMIEQKHVIVKQMS